MFALDGSGMIERRRKTVRAVGGSDTEVFSNRVFGHYAAPEERL